MHYLDYAATTPLLPEAREAMLEVLEGEFGNPSSVHAFGRRAKQIVEDSRDRVAAAVGASPGEIVFTGGGTEASNLAIKGATHKLRGNGNHVVTSTFEHHAVLDSVEWLGHQGLETTYLAPNGDGLVEPSTLEEELRASTILVSIMAVNNEIGTVQDVEALAAATHRASKPAVFHTDAVQALGKIPVDVHAWGVDLASFAAHKLGGPKGVGALFVRSHTPVEAIVHGGGQEKGLRSGTINVAGVAGFGVAAEIAAKEVHETAERITRLRDRLLAGLKATVPDLVVNGTLDAHVPNTLNVAIPKADAETLLLLLDREGIACSAGSACQSGAMDPSHVLLAIGVPRDLAKGSLRFSLGRDSTTEDVEAVLELLPRIVEQARRVA
ncbi:MAG: cysteine desulfurase [Actinomycetota bacterium]|nr:cysteine desulfurase [Actinomycetota bacterium]